MKVEGINRSDVSKIRRELKDLLKNKELSKPAKKTNADEKEKKISEKTIEIKSINRTVRFEIDKELQRVIAKVIDKETGEVIRQIPPEEVVKIAKFLLKTGLLYKREA